MKHRVHATMLVKPWLGISAFGVDQTEIPGSAPDCNCRGTTAGEMCIVANQPSGREQASLPRVHSVPGLANVVRVECRCLAVGICAHPNGTRSNMIGPILDERPQCPGDCWQRLQSLCCRTIIS